MKQYVPKPIETFDVQLPRDLNRMMEELSRSNHEIWSLHRLEEGWKYGPNRDDERKETPCLVPYDELPESEKDIDRNTSKQTLKSIYKLGFAITKRTTGNVMIVGSYSEKDAESLKIEARKYELSSFFYSDWASARVALERDLSKWNSIVLDTKSKLSSSEDETDFFLRNVLDDLTAIFNRNRNEIPWFILPRKFDHFTEALIKFTVGRERERKDWGMPVFPIDDQGNKLFANIAEILPNTRNYRIKCVYDEVFEVMDELYPKRTKNILMNILLPLHYPETFYSFEPTGYYNGIRRILESTFEVCYKGGLIPGNVFYHDNNNSINLRYCCDYLVYGQINPDRNQRGKGICVSSIGTQLESILNIANEGSHMGNEYKTEGLYYSIMAFSLQLCDVIKWLGKYIKNHSSSSMESYKDKYILVEKDSDGRYYHENCLLEDSSLIKEAYSSQKLIKITKVKINKDRNSRSYSFYAYCKE